MKVRKVRPRWRRAEPSINSKAQGEQRQYCRTDGQHAPLRDRHDRAFEIEFLLAGSVVNAPVRADRAFVAGFPRLIEGFDHEVVEALAVELVDQRAQVDRLIRLAYASAPPRMWPLLGQPTSDSSSGFFGNMLFQFAGAVENELSGLVHRDEFPVRQDVRGDQVNVLGQFRVVLPRRAIARTWSPALSRRRARGRGQPISSLAVISLRKSASLPTTTRTTLREVLASSMAVVISRSLRSRSGLIQIPRVTRRPNSSASFGMSLQGAVDRVDADVVRLLAHDLQVAAHFFIGRIVILLWVSVPAGKANRRSRRSVPASSVRKPGG